MPEMKTNPLSKEALMRLERLKRPGESISDVILRITDQNPNRSRIMAFEGIFEDSLGWETLENDLYKTRLVTRKDQCLS